MKSWEGLGYYSRAINLKKTAAILLKDFDGRLPNEIEKLKTLPGIGEYTSRSILSIAYNQPYIPMDGNVERILKRVFLLKTKKQISKEIAELNELKSGLQAKWEAEKSHVDAIQQAKQEIENLKIDAEQAERNGDFGRVAEIRYSKLKQLEEKINEEKKLLLILQSSSKLTSNVMLFSKIEK